MTTPTQRTQGSWQNIGLDRNMGQDNELYEIELNRWLKGEVQDMIFTEFRLRHGVYGQRQEGVQMIRIKLPLGMVSAKQMDVMADLAEELADGVSHITTRQDIQYHNVDIRNTPEMLARLAEVGITTKEACGNAVRNVCACTKTGVCQSEIFDTTSDALAMSEFLLGHPDAQDFGRKFKISYSGCAGEMCGLAKMHDIGAVAKSREINGVIEYGYEVFIGGGLGAVPRQGRILYEFATRQEMFGIAQAISRVFTRHGERRNRNKARFKFVVDRFGAEEIRKMIDEERTKLPASDPLRDGILAKYNAYDEKPLKPATELNLDAQSPEFQRWYKHNVEPQRQKGYSFVHIFLPLGDISSTNLRRLSTIARKYIQDSVRLSVEQNIVFRWVSDGDLPALYQDIKSLNLHGIANILGDVTSCPGTDSCKLGIASSRGLASTLHERFLEGDLKELSEQKGIKIKISGCPNSCGQHHVAEIGFLGSAQSKQGKVAPVFQMVLGGTTQANGDSFGLVVGKLSPHRVPEAITRLKQFYAANQQGDENFTAFVERIGKPRIKEELNDLMTIPSYEEAPQFFTDFHQVREFAVSTGKGECAGELVLRTEFLLDECDRQNAQAVVYVDQSRWKEAYEFAVSSMQKAAKALLLTQGFEEFGNYSTSEEFKTKFVETGVFLVKCAEYYFKTLNEDFGSLDHAQIRYTVEQANLFVEEAHVVYSKIAQTVKLHQAPAAEHA